MRIFEENLGCEYELSPMQSIYAIFITFFSPCHFTFSHSPPHSSFSFYLLFYCLFLYKRVFWKCKYFWKNLILFLNDVNKTFRSPYLAEIVLIREPCQKYQSWLYKLFFFRDLEPVCSQKHVFCPVIWLSSSKTHGGPSRKTESPLGLQASQVYINVTQWRMLEGHILN